MTNIARMVGDTAGLHQNQPSRQDALDRKESTKIDGRCRQRPILPELQLALRLLYILLLAPTIIFEHLANLKLGYNVQSANNLIFFVVSHGTCSRSNHITDATWLSWDGLF